MPTPHIARAAAFRPALPAKIEAAAHCRWASPTSWCSKADEALREELPQNSRLFGHTDRAATGSYHLRPFGRPLIEGYFGGENARRWRGRGSAVSWPLPWKSLPGIWAPTSKRLSPIASSAWAGDIRPRLLLVARPGGAGARAVLAEPVDGRLFFAGEATSLADFSTAHGAYESGVRAAEEALAALLPGRLEDANRIS